MTLIGKRDNLSRSLEGGDEEESPSAFSFVPIFGGRGTKMQKAGLALGSMLAITTCMLALFGGAEVPQVEEVYIDHGQARSLMAVDDAPTPVRLAHTTISMPVVDRNETINVSSTSWSIGNESLIPYSAPCHTYKDAKDFLSQTYKLEGMRDEYIDKSIQRICAEQAFGSVETHEATDIAIYQPNYRNLQSHQRDAPTYLKSSWEKFCANPDKLKKFEKLSDRTTTLYSDKPSLILPSDVNGNPKTLEYSEDDSQYLHIILPTSEINILNSEGRKHSGISSQDNMFVEIGCKIFEVNHLTTKSETLNM